MDKERIDEALELLWVLIEEEHQSLARFRLSSEDDDIEALITALQTEGLVLISGDNISFTDTGRLQAKALPEWDFRYFSNSKAFCLSGKAK